MKKVKIMISVVLLLASARFAYAETLSIEVQKEPKATSEKFAQSMFELGKVQYEAKSFEAAIAYFLEAERVASNKTKGGAGMFVSMFTDELWENKENYYYLGLAYRDAEKYEEAVSAFEKVTKLDKENHVAFLLMGQAYISTGKKSNGGKGSEACKKAVKIKDDLMDAYMCIANANMMNNAVNPAVKALEQAIETDPKYVPAYEMAIEILENTSKPEKADPFKEKLAKVKGG